ncbi:MAG TPA: immunity protein Tsi6 family protein [Nannocystis sp.]
MLDSPRILSRDAFMAALDDARRRVLERDFAHSTVLQQIAAQLEFMARVTAGGRVPEAEERAKTSIGAIAARHLESTDPEFAALLEELDYTFHRYPLLPAGPPVRRRAILQVWTGRESFRKLVFEPCVPRTVGSGDADFVVHAAAGGSAHVQVVWSGVCAHVQAVGPHRLTTDGKAAWYGELSHGGWMTAGGTTYRFFVEDYTSPPTPVAPTPELEPVFAALEPRRDAGTLYAVLDAARSTRALQLIAESVDPYASLYDGERGRALDDVAPYLVHLRRDSRLLEHLVTEGWGDAWGLYLESRADFDVVRRHLRRFLMVEVEGERRRLLFRFYDPRVMRTFAGGLTDEERGQLLEHLEAILYPGAAQDVQALTRA